MQALMPDSGNPFQFSWQEYAIWGTLVTVFLVLTYTKRLPSMEAFKSFVDAINSAGGHILLLALFSIYFFKVSMQYIYHVLNLPDDVVSKQNAIIMVGIGFVTGTAFGGSWAALLKTMTGAKANGTTPNEVKPPDTK